MLRRKHRSLLTVYVLTVIAVGLLMFYPTPKEKARRLQQMCATAERNKNLRDALRKEVPDLLSSLNTPKTGWVAFVINCDEKTFDKCVVIANKATIEGDLEVQITSPTRVFKKNKDGTSLFYWKRPAKKKSSKKTPSPSPSSQLKPGNAPEHASQTAAP